MDKRTQYYYNDRWQGGILTVSSNIIYMDQHRDNRLNANCYCIKSGRQMSYFEVEITDGGGRPVASVTTTGMHLSGEKL